MSGILSTQLSGKVLFKVFCLRKNKQCIYMITKALDTLTFLRWQKEWEHIAPSRSEWLQELSIHAVDVIKL